LAAEGPEAVLPEAADPPPLRPWLGSLVPQDLGLPPIPSPSSSAVRDWSLASALTRALEANPEVQVALATVQRHEGLRLQAGGALWPRLALVASTNQRAKGLIDRSPNESNFPPSQQTAVAERSYDYRVEVRQTLFNGLANWHQVRRMALLHKKAGVDAREVYLRIASQVRQAYEATLLRQTLVETRREAVRDLGRLAEVAKKRYAAGEISEFESLRAETSLRAAEADLAQVEADWTRTQELFCRLLYIDKPTGGVRVTGTMQPLAYSGTFDGALRRARLSRLDVRSAELQLEAAQVAQRVARGGLMPRFEAFVDYGYRSSYYDVRQQLEGWTVGVLGRWDLFDGAQTRGGMLAQRAESRIAEIRLAEARQRVGSQVRELFDALEQSRTVMMARASERDFGERGVREAARLYQLGRISLEQVLNAEMAHRQAQAGWLGAVFNHNITIHQLDYSTADEAFLNAVSTTVK